MERGDLVLLFFEKMTGEKDMGEITCIADFIGKINKVVKQRNAKKENIVVYRGEPQKYPIPGKPGIFRDRFIEREPYFEKNLLDEMKANRVTLGESYLECAVDAQHDEFPSRLLDVTYNALVALYFAVTPYYKRYSEDAYDNKFDAQVVIYFIPKMYCAGASNIKEIFEDTVKRDKPYLLQPLIQENYKLIDHIKMNTRICVQQGAFILFQGDNYSPISPKDYEVIVIKKEYRKQLREELNNIFGINTGYIYPEPFNLYSTMGEKAYKIISQSTNEITELDSFMKRVEDEVEYYHDKTIDICVMWVDEEKKKNEILKLVMEVERLLYKYKEELDMYTKTCVKECAKDYKEEFNLIICRYDSLFAVYEEKYDITRSVSELSFDMMLEEK